MAAGAVSQSVGTGRADPASLFANTMTQVAVDMHVEAEIKARDAAIMVSEPTGLDGRVSNTGAITDLRSQKGLPGRRPLVGTAHDTEYVVLGGADRFLIKDGSQVHYTFDDAGQPFWSTGGKIWDIPAPFAQPTLAELQQRSIAGSFSSGFLDEAANAWGQLTTTLSRRYDSLGLLGTVVVTAAEGTFAPYSIAGSGVTSATNVAAGIYNNDWYSVGTNTFTLGIDVGSALLTAYVPQTGTFAGKLGSPLLRAGKLAGHTIGKEVSRLGGYVSDFAAGIRSYGVPDWEIGFKPLQGGTFYSNPLPLELRSLELDAPNSATRITERTVITTAGLDEQVGHITQMVPGLEVAQAKALLQSAFNPNKPVEVVIGGSRVRSFFGEGSFRPDSDLDIGFAAKMKNHQIDNILDAFDSAGALKSERGIRIFSGNNPPSGPIVSPQEFFQRSGIRGPFPPERAGQPFGPSGFISVHPNGTITIVPPGIN